MAGAPQHGGGWREACRQVTNLRKLIQLEGDLARGSPRGRLQASAELATYFQGDSDTHAKMAQVAGVSARASWRGRLMAELTALGDRAFDWCTPGTLGEHGRVFTAALASAVLSLFWWMAADWRNYRGEAWGPSTAWASQTYDAAFLTRWGGLHLPSLRGQAWRWLSGLLVHNGFVHALSNLLLLLLLSLHLERRYGPARVALIAALGGVGGSLFSASLEDGCAVVVGASGVAFGLFGLWVADLVVSFHSLQYGFTRVLLALAFVGFQVGSAATRDHVSHYSHLGGLVAGFFPGCCCLPRSGHGRLEAALPVAGAVVAVAVFGGLPAYVYAVRLDRLAC